VQKGQRSIKFAFFCSFWFFCGWGRGIPGGDLSGGGEKVVWSSRASNWFSVAWVGCGCGAALQPSFLLCCQKIKKRWGGAGLTFYGKKFTALSPAPGGHAIGGALGIVRRPEDLTSGSFFYFLLRVIGSWASAGKGVREEGVGVGGLKGVGLFPLFPLSSFGPPRWCGLLSVILFPDGWSPRDYINFFFFWMKYTRGHRNSIRAPITAMFSSENGKISVFGPRVFANFVQTDPKLLPGRGVFFFGGERKLIFPNGGSSALLGGPPITTGGRFFPRLFWHDLKNARLKIGRIFP